MENSLLTNINMDMFSKPESEPESEPEYNEESPIHNINNYIMYDEETVYETFLNIICDISLENTKCLEKNDNNKINYIKINNDLESVECVICKEFLTENVLAQLDCGHSFHIFCIEEWGKYSMTCPICRINVK